MRDQLPKSQTETGQLADPVNQLNPLEDREREIFNMPANSFITPLVGATFDIGKIVLNLHYPIKNGRPKGFTINCCIKAWSRVKVSLAAGIKYEKSETSFLPPTTKLVASWRPKSPMEFTTVSFLPIRGGEVSIAVGVGLRYQYGSLGLLARPKFKASDAG